MGRDPGRASPEHPSSSPSRASPTVGMSTPSSSPNLDRWQKPSKVVHHRSPEASSGEVFVDGAPLVAAFGPLVALGDRMDLGHSEAGPLDQHMVDLGSGSLKWGRSP